MFPPNHSAYQALTFRNLYSQYPYLIWYCRGRIGVARFYIHNYVTRLMTRLINFATSALFDNYLFAEWSSLVFWSAEWWNVIIISNIPHSVHRMYNFNSLSKSKGRFMSLHILDIPSICMTLSRKYIRYGQSSGIMDKCIICSTVFPDYRSLNKRDQMLYSFNNGHYVHMISWINEDGE